MRREYQVDLDHGHAQGCLPGNHNAPGRFQLYAQEQTGGSGQYGRVAGFIEPSSEGDYQFLNKITGGAIPTEFIASCDKGFQACLKKGPLSGFPIVGVQVTINDGASHTVDSSDLAFQQAAIGAFREAYLKATPSILEPVMKVVAETPFRISGDGARHPEPAARHHYQHLGRSRLSPPSRPKCPLPKCSGTRPYCVPRLRGRPNSPWNSPEYNPVPKKHCRRDRQELQRRAAFTEKQVTSGIREGET